MKRRNTWLGVGVGATLTVSGLIVGLTGVLPAKAAALAAKSPPVVLGSMIFVSNRLGIISGTPNGNDIWTMEANGANPVPLTDNDWAEYEPQWSPDLDPGAPGYQGLIAFTSNREAVLQGLPFDANWDVYTMNPDGSGVTNLTNNPAREWHPAWSPDGTKIAFFSDRNGNEEIYVVNADGSGQTRVTTNAAIDYLPTWSPDSTKIAFTSYRTGGGDIYSMNANGSGLKRLTTSPSEEAEPAWSPDGTKIVYYRRHDVENHEIYTMNADGKQQLRLTNNYPFLDVDPTWKP